MSARPVMRSWVGANTVRRDNPLLLVRSAARRADRASLGLSSSPAKVTVSASGDLNPDSQFFTAGETDVARLVFCPDAAAADLARRLDGLPGVEVIGAGRRADMAAVLSGLTARGIGRLLTEGGTTIHTQLLGQGLADELHLVVAPFFVGGGGAPRFVSDARFPFDATHPTTLAEYAG